MNQQTPREARIPPRSAPSDEHVESAKTKNLPVNPVDAKYRHLIEGIDFRQDMLDLENTIEVLSGRTEKEQKALDEQAEKRMMSYYVTPPSNTVSMDTSNGSTEGKSSVLLLARKGRNSSGSHITNTYYAAD